MKHYNILCKCVNRLYTFKEREMDKCNKCHEKEEIKKVKGDKK